MRSRARAHGPRRLSAALHADAGQQAKAAYEAGAGVLEVPKAPLARVEDFQHPARDGHALPARLYAPSDAALPVLLYFHGGGFTIGSIATHDMLCRELSRLSGCAVVSLDYRLAPEHVSRPPFDDAWDAHAMAGRARRRSWGSTAAAWPSAATAPAARWPRSARSWRATPGCRSRCSCCSTRAAPPGQDTPSHERFGHGLILEKPHIDWFFDQYIDRARARRLALRPAQRRRRRRRRAGLVRPGRVRPAGRRRHGLRR